MTSVTRPEAVSQALAHWHKMVAQGVSFARCAYALLRCSGGGFDFKHGRQGIY